MSTAWSYVNGAEEFFYLLTRCFTNYGPNIGSGLYNEAALVKRKQDMSFEYGKDTSQNYERAVKCRKRGEWEPMPAFPPSHSSSSPNPSHDKRIFDDRGTAVNQSRSTGPFGLPGRQQPISSRAKEGQGDETFLVDTIRSMKVTNDSDESVLPFDDIAGLDDAKLALEEFACFFLHFPHLTHNLRQRSTTGILLFGPQGTGKTLLIKSFAKKYQMSLYDIRASAIMSKFVGEAEKFVRTLFKEVRANSPAILMLDECEGLLCNPSADAQQSHHYRLLQNELKNQWSDLIYSKDEVIVVGATNKPHDIDMDGFGRRLSTKLHVGLPSETACSRILRGALSRVRHCIEDADFGHLGKFAFDRGLSGYDIDCMVEGLLRRAIRDITIATFFKSILWQNSVVYVPCEPHDAHAIKGPWTNFTTRPEDISYHPFATRQVQAAIERTRPTVDERMVQRHIEFASQYGTDD